MTIWYRKVSIWYPKRIFSISLSIYVVVALTGFLLGFFHNDFTLPPFPNGKVLLYILGEGFFIPVAWLFSYKLLSIIGASSMAIAQSVNFLTTALFGIILLGDPFSLYLLVGGSLLISGVILALTVNKQGAKKTNKARTSYKIALLLAGSICLAFGLIFEKLAIDSIGVWDYALYGWGMQLVGAIVLFVIFGRNELKKEKLPNFWRKSFFAGFLTAISGGLFIYSLSKGLLSSVILASSAKVALTSVLAFWILRERNHLAKRVTAMLLSILGLLVIFGL
jgi:drug/metabolite transporter (DMT)-like permease